MALRYHGDPIVVVTPEDRAEYLYRTANLPDGEYDGGLLRFAEEIAGNIVFVHYMVTRAPKRGATWEVRRVVGLAGDNQSYDVPAGLIKSMSNKDVAHRVNEMKIRYRNEANLQRSRGEQSRAKQGVSRIRGRFDGTIASHV